MRNFLQLESERISNCAKQQPSGDNSCNKDERKNNHEAPMSFSGRKGRKDERGRLIKILSRAATLLATSESTQYLTTLQQKQQQ